jgi:multidrug efflux pump subunit AcrA (membrane-fusion protein)
MTEPGAPPDPTPPISHPDPQPAASQLAPPTGAPHASPRVTAAETRRVRVVTAVVVGVGMGVAILFHRQLVGWFTGSSSSGSTSAAAHVAAGALSIDAAVQPDPPIANGDRAHVMVRDAQGQPVLGARVRLAFDMPAMGAMQAMHGAADAREDGGGRYTIPFDLGMEGSWTISLQVTAAAGAATARYTLRTGASGLVPLGGEAGATAQPGGVIHIAEARRALLGIRTTKVVRAPIDLEITAKGRVTVDETRLHEITLKIGGYITDLRVSASGQAVRKGDTLFTLYSPELYAAEQEYLLARQNAALSHGDVLIHAAETKLRLWGFGDDQLRAIAATNEPLERVPFKAPASGVVIEHNVVDGGAVMAGARLFRIADLDQVWVEADVYEADLPRIAKGMPSTIRLSYLPARTFEGKVAFVYPYLDPASRTGRVRIALPNQGLELKPDMFATVTFKASLGPRLLVPTSAVVYTGPRRLVFLDLGSGALRPREVTLGARTGDNVEIVSGVEDGDVVVSSGNFLVAAESRVRAAGSLWEDRDVTP